MRKRINMAGLISSAFPDGRSHRGKNEKIREGFLKGTLTLEEARANKNVLLATFGGKNKSTQVSTESSILEQYASVWVLGKWHSTKKFYGSLMYMFNNNYKFK